MAKQAKHGRRQKAWKGAPRLTSRDLASDFTPPLPLSRLLLLAQTARANILPLQLAQNETLPPPAPPTPPYLFLLLCRENFFLSSSTCVFFQHFPNFSILLSNLRNHGQQGVGLARAPYCLHCPLADSDQTATSTLSGRVPSSRTASPPAPFRVSFESPQNHQIHHRSSSGSSKASMTIPLPLNGTSRGALSPIPSIPNHNTSPGTT